MPVSPVIESSRINNTSSGVTSIPGFTALCTPCLKSITKDLTLVVLAFIFSAILGLMKAESSSVWLVSHKTVLALNDVFQTTCFGLSISTSKKPVLYANTSPLLKVCPAESGVMMV